MASDKVLVPVRQPGQTSCVHHPERTVTLFCELCEDLACLTCLSTVHKGHEMCALSELTAATRTQMEKYINNTEKQRCVQLQLLINWAENDLLQTSVKYNQLTENIERQGKLLKLQIDVFTCMFKGLYKQLEEENKRNMESYITELRSRLDALNDNLQNCKHILANGTDIQMYDTGHKLITEPEETHPAQPKCHCYSFIPNKSPRNYLEQAFGKLTTSAEQKPKIHTKKLSEFNSSDFISSICPNGDG
ncbi:E3 ubiquitin-protein ligase TRIM71-like [Pecten maximus]|uniref:E3 ubiquitin-protein ligase TRIM71-like n=1 Tax=Pecten maximus TaxID=6579 RepID=UPI001458FFF0|nr:E3 ubiquitin-protein ligase TRIM71-like [Pecten maximus]